MLWRSLKRQSGARLGAAIKRPLLAPDPLLCIDALRLVLFTAFIRYPLEPVARVFNSLSVALRADVEAFEA